MLKSIAALDLARDQVFDKSVKQVPEILSVSDQIDVVTNSTHRIKYTPERHFFVTSFLQDLLVRS